MNTKIKIVSLNNRSSFINTSTCRLNNIIEMNMETIFLYVFGFIIIMTLILWLIPNKKIEVIGNFFVTVLPKILLAGMIRAYLETKDKNDTKRKGKKRK